MESESDEDKSADIGYRKLVFDGAYSFFNFAENILIEMDHVVPNFSFFCLFPIQFLSYKFFSFISIFVIVLGVVSAGQIIILSKKWLFVIGIGFGRWD